MAKIELLLQKDKKAMSETPSIKIFISSIDKYLSTLNISEQTPMIYFSFPNDTQRKKNESFNLGPGIY